jgi:hypothetical protein
MGALISDMSKAGVLLAVEGLLPSSKGLRVRIDGSAFSIAPGPFRDDIIGGFCMLQVKTQEEAVEWCKRFLKAVKQGESEIRLLHDAPPPAARA